MGDASEALLMPSFVLRSAEHFGVTNAVAALIWPNFGSLFPVSKSIAIVNKSCQNLEKNDVGIPSLHRGS